MEGICFMKEYTAKKIVGEMTVEDERWARAEKIALTYTWDAYLPIPYATEAAMVHSDAGVTVLLSTSEWPIRVTEMENGGRVCVDSCMEFFFTPNESEQKYINLELNPAGTLHFNIGEGRGTREKVAFADKGVRVRTLISHGEGWKALIFVPYSLIDALYGKHENVFKANFYKCGDMTEKVHYATWNPVLTEKPDYHRPEFFGKVILSEEIL